MKYFCVLILVALTCQAGPIEYKEGETFLEGYLAASKSAGTHPGVIVVPDWMGMTDFAKGRADELARMGYVALAADVYGKGVRPATTQEAGKLAGNFKDDRKLLRARVNAALEELRRQPDVDAKHIVAIGYCFGGTAALELARSGADIAGVVIFHGGLDTPTPADAKNIKCKVLALHGADDPFVPAAQVAAFEKEMTDAGVDWQLIKYSGAVHAFAVPGAGTYNAKGAAYNERADRRSWQAMKLFFDEIFR